MRKYQIKLLLCMLSVLLHNNSISQPLLSGSYGEQSIGFVSLAEKGDTITGVYEYYGGWEPRTKSFLQACVFYFYGVREKSKSSTISLKAKELGNNTIIKGELTIPNQRKKIQIKLDEQPNGYAAVGFDDDTGFVGDIFTVKTWSQVGVIKATKALLYDEPEVSKKRKAYLVREDVVKIIHYKNEWIQVEYLSPVTNKLLVAWLKRESLFEVNPEKW